MITIFRILLFFSSTNVDIIYIVTEFTKKRLKINKFSTRIVKETAYMARQIVKDIHIDPCS